MSKDDDFRERLRIAERVRKLLALAKDQEGTPEGDSARERAGRLIALYKLDAQSLRPIDEKPVWQDTWDQFSAFARNIHRFAPGREDLSEYRKYAEDEDDGD